MTGPHSTASEPPPKGPFDLSKVRVRNALNPRREPYWAPKLDDGRYIGFRKMPHETKPGVVTSEAWIARARTDGRQQYHKLGALTDTNDYDAACKVARTWFASLDAGVTLSERVTVEAACKKYVDDRRREKGPKTAADAEWRFKANVYGTAFGKTELAKLHTPAIKDWRAGLKLTPAGANRMMATLRAALNLAVENKQVNPAAAREWHAVKQHKNADGRREIYLDLAQRRALMASAKGAVADLIEAAIVTGARPGELANALRSAFDARTKTLMLTGKTGTRKIPLPPAAVTLFERVSKSKLPTAPLLSRDDGKPWTRAEWTELVREAADNAVVKAARGRKKAKLPPGVCLYSLRHSFITQALTDGLTPLDVARITGTSLTMIDRHYAQWLHSSSAAQLAKVHLL